MGLTHDDVLVNVDALCEIDIHTRKITRKSKKGELVQYDHNSERIGFTMERYNDGHDMSQCDRVAVKYLNVRNDDTYVVNDVSVSDDGKTVTFTWLVSGNATQEVGSLIFLVNFRCWNDEGVITYNWSTQPCSSYSILKGVTSMDSNPKEQYDFWAKYKGLVDGVVGDTEKVGAKLGVLTDDAENLDVELKNMTDTSNQLGATLEDLTQNVPILETKVESLNQKVPTLEDKVSTLDRALEDDVAYSLSKGIDTLEESTSHVYLKKSIVNLFDKSKAESGYYNPYLTLKSEDQYDNTGPIYLAKGDYLFRANVNAFGESNSLVVIRKDGESISLHEHVALLDGSYIAHVSVESPGFYIFNIGAKGYGDVTVDDFMLVSGLTELDFPSEYVSHAKKIEEDVEFSDSMIRVIDDRISSSISSKGFSLNPLYNKIAVFDGDSICRGSSAGDDLYGWAGRIGNANSMRWHNVGKSGGTIMAGLYSGESPRHWVSNNIDAIHEQYPDLDYLILEGGTNDADLVGPDNIGEVSSKYYMYDDFDNTADFTQALEYLFSKAISYYPTKKIGFIISQKMGTTASSYKTAKRRVFFDRCIEVCEKYGIPYLDLWNTCHLNPTIDRASHDGTYYMYTDGQHLSAAGYEYISPIIEAWMKTL